MTPTAFEFRGVHKRFPSGFELHIDELELVPGRIYGILGPNGSGKSTILRLLAGLIPPDEGHVLFEGQPLFPGAKGLALRRRIALASEKPVMFQGTILRNVLLGLKFRGVDGADALEKATAAIQLVGLDAARNRLADSLSGGEAQRVAIARILCLDTDALLLDEPTAHVDRATIDKIETCLKKRNSERGVTIVFTTHDQDQARRLTRNLLRLENGRLAIELGD